MLTKGLSFAAFSLVVVGCFTSSDKPSSSSATSDSAFSACGRLNEECCESNDVGESGGSHLPYCSKGLSCETVGEFEKCVKIGKPADPGPPKNSCGYVGNLCCPSIYFGGENGWSGPYCEDKAVCRTIDGMPTCVNPKQPSPIAAKGLCGGKGERCCPSSDFGESGGSHAPSCDDGLSCDVIDGEEQCN